MKNIIKILLLSLFVFGGITSADTINSTSKNPSMLAYGAQRDSSIPITASVIPIAVSGAGCNSGTDTIAVTFDHSSQLICQSGTWQSVGGGVKTRVAHNAVWGFRWPYANVQCNANEVVVGAGAACTGGGGFGWVYSNSPTGNGWQVSCNDARWETILAEVWAICAIK